MIQSFEDIQPRKDPSNLVDHCCSARFDQCADTLLYCYVMDKVNWLHNSVMHYVE